MKNVTNVLIASVVLHLSPHVAKAQNLLINPGFEDEFPQQIEFLFGMDAALFDVPGWHGNSDADTGLLGALTMMGPLYYPTENYFGEASAFFFDGTIYQVLAETNPDATFELGTEYTVTFHAGLPASEPGFGSPGWDGIEMSVRLFAAADYDSTLANVENPPGGRPSDFRSRFEIPAVTELLDASVNPIPAPGAWERWTVKFRADGTDAVSENVGENLLLTIGGVTLINADNVELTGEPIELEPLLETAYEGVFTVTSKTFLEDGDFTVGDRFRIRTTLAGAADDEDMDASGGTFPGLGTGFSIERMDGNAGAWDPSGGIYRMGWSSFRTTPSVGRLFVTFRGEGYPDSSNGYLFTGVSLDYTGVMPGFTDSGGGEMFAQQTGGEFDFQSAPENNRRVSIHFTQGGSVSLSGVFEESSGPLIEIGLVGSVEEPRVQIGVQTVAGFSYEILQTVDFGTWTSTDVTLVGDGTAQTAEFDVGGGGVFYRAVQRPGS